MVLTVFAFIAESGDISVIGWDDSASFESNLTVACFRKLAFM